MIRLLSWVKNPGMEPAGISNVNFKDSFLSSMIVVRMSKKSLVHFIWGVYKKSWPRLLGHTVFVENIQRKRFSLSNVKTFCVLVCVRDA